MEDRERLAKILAELPVSQVPKAHVIGEPGAPRSAAVLPGAFNPPTGAHLALARLAANRGFDRVLFSLGTVTLDKSTEGIPLADRLHLLRKLAAAIPAAGVIVQNRGLYVDIAAATRRALPTVVDLVFVIGMDKAPQLFDPRYYDDPERRLAELFSQARFLVASRDDDDREVLARLLARPEAMPWADRFEWVETPERWRRHSATRVRAGDPEMLADLPEEVADYLKRHRPFDRTDRRPG